jgi:hypothetical protein
VRLGLEGENFLWPIDIIGLLWHHRLMSNRNQAMEVSDANQLLGGELDVV